MHRCALLVASSVVVLLAFACGTDAVGVDACRNIENARCEAAPVCKGDDFSFGITTETQVRNCKTLYRDQCLHGLENIDGGEPSDGKVTKCVKAIRATAACKKAGALLIAECVDVSVIAGAEGKSPCEILTEVEHLTECAFVAPPPKEGEDTSATTAAATTGAGGAGGAGGS